MVAAVGSVVATYLLYVERSGVIAVSGPFGDCNIVLHSKHAGMFGLLPVSAISLLGYSAMIVAWIVTRRTTGTTSDLAKLSVFGIASTGTAMTIYLVYLQPFVIGATCAWCLTSAIVITILMWLSAPAVGVAWSNVYAALPRAIDSSLAETIRRQLRSKILPSYNEIGVVVKRRRVTLDGGVGAACHRDLAEHVASSVAGVKTVNNQITVLPSEDPRVERCGRVTREPFTRPQIA